jgi:predicted Zn finger-like uncharacterized protein
MIVQCEECKTSFNLDEKRLRGDSAKVRCSKCKHVFMIYKEQEELAAATMDDMFSEPMPTISQDDTFAMASPLDDDTAFASTMFTESSEETAQVDSFSSTFDEISYPTEPAVVVTEPVASSENFAFSEMTLDVAPTPVAAAEPEAIPSITPPKPAFNDDMLSFADVTPTDEELAATPAPKKEIERPAPAATTFDFDFSGASEPPEQAAPAETFEHGGFDFSVPTPEPVKEASTTFTFASDEESTPTFIPVPSAEDTAGESVFSIYRPFAIAGLCATAVVTLLTVGYFMIKGSPGNLERMGISSTATSSEVEKGSFAITAPKAMFIKNKAAGELFVVSGTATNGFKTPRMGVEVQVILFNRKGEELATKTAFCGSTLDIEQLNTLPLAKIEEELAKAPSDDPLENTPIEPGKTTDCLVVFKDVPKLATDYGIEVTHSKGEQLDDFK